MLERLTPTFYASLCTLLAPVVTINSYGEEVITPAVIVELENLPCRIAPKGNKEAREPQQTYAEATHHVTLAGYYPTVNHSMIPVVDGVPYAMEGEPEWDGNSQTTRFYTRLVNP